MDRMTIPQNGSEGLPPHIAAAVQAGVQCVRRVQDWTSAIFADDAPTATYRRWLPGDPEPPCDCPMNPYHRWNCSLTPIWAQTIRDLDVNPWTVIRPRDLALDPDNVHDHCYGGDEHGEN